jgi:hypothetical protein
MFCRLPRNHRLEHRLSARMHKLSCRYRRPKCRASKRLLLALSGRPPDRVARSGSGRKADIPKQRVEFPLMTLTADSAAWCPWRERPSESHSAAAFASCETTPDYAVRFDVEGRPIEPLSRAYRPGEVTLYLSGRPFSLRVLGSVMGT